jgi:pilus assembly protein CpaE
VETDVGEFPWGRRSQPDTPAGQIRGAATIGVSAALGLRAEQLHSLAALFPAADFTVLNERQPLPSAGFAVVVSRVAAADADQAAARLRSLREAAKVIVVLDGPNLAVTRTLMANGAADVLYEPITETALALSLERVFAGLTQAAGGPSRSGEVVALLKAGGGVGATTLGVQAGAMLSARGQRVCFADLDVQWGMAGLYLDLADALNVTDCITAGAHLSETNFASRLATHRSGLRLLAAPNDVAPLELLHDRHVDSLLRTLRQEMGLTIVDLPSDWAAWTNHLLHAADRIVVVTRLTVGNIQLLKRQLRMLTNQQLDAKPVRLVCNAVSQDQQNSLPIKTAERALGREFDVILPDEARLMREANNQGVELSALRGSAKLLKSVTALADALAATNAIALTAKR